jgi:hypothetical protein
MATPAPPPRVQNFKGQTSPLLRVDIPAGVTVDCASIESVSAVPFEKEVYFLADVVVRATGSPGAHQQCPPPPGAAHPTPSVCRVLACVLLLLFGAVRRSPWLT